MPGYTLSNLGITETFYGWFEKTNDIIEQLNSISGQGVSSAGLSGDNLIITLIDGSTFDTGSVVGPTGAAVSGAAITNGELILTLDNGDSINAGYVKGPTGETGADGPIGTTGHTGATGQVGEGVPTGGNIGYALVKASNTDLDTEWSDITSLSRANPGLIGGFEAGTGERIFGSGLSTEGRDLYPRWSTNYYLSEVHSGAGISMSGATGMYEVAGEMVGYTSGYDDGLTSGIKVLNFLESTKMFESNLFTRGSCTGETLDGPPGFYWNRMKYFPTVKLQPIYVANYCTVDKYIAYIAGYENNATDPQRRGTYGWFGMIPVNGFPVGTPESKVKDFNGFVDGSTCAYFFRDSGIPLSTSGLAVAETDDEFAYASTKDIEYIGDDIVEVTPGRTGPIGLYSSAAGKQGLSGGFTLSPGWYYIASEIIPAAWFSVGSPADNIPEGDSYRKGYSADQLILTHTDASRNEGSSNLFGLNGFELAPEGEETGVGTPFTPSAYLGIASITADMKTLPTGLPPHLWYSQGKSGASAGGRFRETDDGRIFLSGNIGLNPIDESVDTEAGITIRAQNAEQASAPRIAISVTSSSSSFDTLRALDPPNAEEQEAVCEFYWDGSVVQVQSVSQTSGDSPFTTDFSADEDGTSWLMALFGSDDGVTFTSPACPDGTCPEFLAPPHHGGTWGQVAPLDQESVYPSDENGIDWLYNEGITFNPQGLTTDGITGSTADGFIQIQGTGGHTYYYGFGLNVPLGVSLGFYDNQIEGCTQSIRDMFEGGGFRYPELNGHFGFGAAGAIPGRNFPTGGVDATISIFVNAQEQLHKKWFGNASGSEKNHLIHFTSTFGCSGDGNYPTYTGP